jgi:hypothetical protein
MNDSGRLAPMLITVTMPTRTISLVNPEIFKLFEIIATVFYSPTIDMKAMCDIDCHPLVVI